MQLEEPIISLEEDVTEQPTKRTSVRNESRAVYAGLTQEGAYTTVKQDLELSGSSLLLDEQEAQAVDNNNVVTRQALEDAVNQAESVDEVQAWLDAYVNIHETKPEQLHKLEAINKVRTNFNTDVQAVLDKHTSIKKLKNSVAKEVVEEDLGVLAGEFVGMALLPFSEQLVAGGLDIPDGMGYEWLLSGEGKTAVNKFINSADPAVIRDAIEALQVSFEKLRDETGLVLSPAIVIGDMLDDDYKDSAWRFVDDAVSVVDSFVVGKLITPAIKVIKAGKVVMTSSKQVDVNSPAIDDITDPLTPMNELGAISPEVSRELVGAAMVSDEAAKALAGVPKAEVYMSKQMPSYNNEGIPLEYNDMPSAIKDFETHTANLQKEILDSTHLSGLQLSKAEQEAQIAKMEAALADTRTIHLKESHTTVTKSEAGYDVGAVYSRTGTHGWDNPEDAVVDTLEALRGQGVDQSNIVILTKTPDGKSQALTQQEAIELAAKSQEPLEYETLVTFNKYWDSTGVEAFTKEQKSSFLSGAGKLTGWFVNPVNRYDKSITSVMNLMKDRAAGTAGKLTEMLAPVAKLNSKSKIKVVELLRKGDANSHRYSSSELSTMIKTGELTEDEAKAVVANYKFWDTVYLIDNRSYARKLSDEGYYLAKGTNKVGQSFEYFGKPATDVKPNEVLDVHTNTVLEEVTDAYTVVKLKDSITDNGKVYKYLAIPNTSTNAVRSVKATDKVLSYREGYYPRRYRGEYFVDRIVTFADGTKEVRSVGNVESAAQGSKLISKLREQEQASNVEFVTRESKELKSELDLFGSDVSEAMFEGIERGRSIQKHRGERLSTFDDTANLEVAPTLDPIETMMSSAFNTGRVALHYDGLAALETRWMKTFGHLTDNKFPRNINGIAGDKDKLGEIEEAKALFTYIQQQRNVADSNIVAGITKKLMYSLGDVLDSKEMTRLANLARTAGGIDPVKTVRSAAFLAFIVGAPFRQALLQTFQLTQVMPLTAKYANPARLMADVMNLKRLAMAGADSKTYKEVLEKTAKSTGMSVQEWEAVVKNFKESGLPQTIDSQQLVEGLSRSLGGEVYSSELATKASAALDMAKAPLRFSKKIGFDFGEMNNLTGTYLVAVQRYAKQVDKTTDKFTARDWAKVSDEARSLSWNMNRADMFDYQKGFTSAPMQFVQVFHKALLFYVMGNKTLTKTERAKIIAANTALFTGIHQAIYEPLVDVFTDAPEDVKQTAENGIFNYGMNTFLSAAESGLRGEDVDVNIDFTGLNPAVGLLESSGSFATSLIELQPPGWSDFPGIVAIDRGAEAFNRTMRMFAGDFGIDMSTPERITKGAMTLSSVFSGSNYATRAFIGAQMEKASFVNAKLQPVTTSNFSELGVYGLFGLSPEEVEDVYKLGSKIYTGKYEAPAVKDIAEQLYKDLETVSLGRPEEDRLMAMQFLIREVLDTEQREAVIREFIKMDKQKNQNYVDRLMHKLIMKSTELDNSQIEAARNYAREHGTANQQYAFDVILKSRED
jgi:hypothetical protein